MPAIRERNDERIVISLKHVLQSLKGDKATGPDGVPPKALKYCADQRLVPTLWKLPEIMPIPQITFPKVFSDLRPIVLTLNIMECLYLIMKNYLCNNIENGRDHLQCANCKNGRCKFNFHY